MNGVHGPPPGEVHVWAIPEPELGDEAARLRCWRLLSPGELARWERMVPTERMLYASAHAGLRAITAVYAGVWPSQVRFRAGQYGKPYVLGRPGLRISLAHTRGMSLVAVTRDGATGVDIERVRAMPGADQLPDLVLSSWEREQWAAGVEGTVRARLFSYWACKEAVLKALGTGLAGNLAAVQVAPGDRLEGLVPIHGLPDSPATRRPWSLRLVNLGPGYRAAVAVAGGGARLRTFRLTPGTLPARPGRLHTH